MDHRRITADGVVGVQAPVPSSFSFVANLADVSSGRVRVIGGIVLAVCLAAWAALPFPLDALQLAAFGALQRLPAQAEESRVTLVAIDEASLDAKGQWPWPRATVAELVERLSAADPLAIGIDIVMSEPGRESAAALLAGSGARLDPSVRAAIAALPDGDARLGEAIRKAPVAVAVLALPGGGVNAAAGPVPPVLASSEAAVAALPRHGAVLRSRPLIDQAAAGHGLAAVEKAEDGIVHRIHLAAVVGGSVFPALPVEMLRLAAAGPAVRLEATRHGIRRVRVGPMSLDTDPDGGVWLRRGTAAPLTVSAADLLAGRADPALFADRFVVIGVTAAGLAERPSTAFAHDASGSEVEAMAVDMLLGGHFAVRPHWARPLEGAALALSGLLFIALMPRLPPRRFVLLCALGLMPFPVVALAAFLGWGLLFDAMVPAALGAVVFAAMLGLLVIHADRVRTALSRALSEQRLHAAWLAGQLEEERRTALDRQHFIEMISHEYRTPLSILVASLDVLELRGDEAVLKVAPRMRRAVQRLVDIVEIGLSRFAVDTDHLSAMLGPVDLSLCVQQALRVTRLSHPLRVVVVTGADRPVKVAADRPLLEIALINVIDNAIKYSPSSAPVELTVEEDAAAKMVTVRVADHGSGMSEEEINQVFDKFFRGANSASKPGMGMGLALTHRIVELHGGHIRLTSRPGMGTVVSVELPLAG